jgi:PAS domain S-box-containing protein
LSDSAEYRNFDQSVYQTLFNAAGDAIILCSDQGRAIECNQAAIELFGTTRERLIDSSPADWSPEFQPNGRRSAEAAAEIFARVKAGEVTRFEWENIRADGSSLPVDVTVRPAKSDDTDLFVVISRDITQQRLAEVVLRRSQAMLARTENFAHIGSWEWHVASDTVTWSDELFRIFQLNPAEGAPTYAEHPNYYYPDDIERLKVAVDACISYGTPYELELRAIRNDGKTRILLTTGSAEMGPGNRASVLFGSSQDITERKQAELVQKASEEKYRALVETTDTGYLIIDMEGRVLDANPAYVRLTGHDDIQDILGRSVVEWTASNQMEMNAAAVAQCARDGFIRNFVIDYFGGNGRVTPIEVNATVVGNGDSSRIIALCRDITLRKQAEDALREREQQYRVLIDKAPDAIVLYDLDANLFVDCNPAAEKLFACCREELLKTGPEQYYPREQFKGSDAREFILKTAVRVIEGAEVKLERAVRTAQGKDLICELNIAYMPSKDRRLVRGSYIDITEKKQAEAELMATKSAAETANLSKSHFLAAASHDLRQPMQAISLFNDALARTSLSGEQKSISDYLSQSIQSMDDLLTALLDISKFDAGAIKANPEAIPVAALIDKINADFSAMAEEKSLRFKLHFPFPDIAIMTDGKLLKSLLGNLIGNAIKYTEKGGILVVIRRRGDQALIQVWDTGIGIPAEHHNAIYEEYFQVDNPERDRTKGLGLGLAIAKRIANLLGTEVVCRSRPGKGSVFEFRLPLASREERKTSIRIDPPAISNEAKPVGRRIALVEDDLMVATAMKLALESSGMTVTRYKTAEEALADSAIADADFYISDLRLPGLSGVEFLDAVQRRATKPIQAIVVTGDTATDRIEMIRSTSWQVLFKPVELSTLLSSIESQDSAH